MKTAVIIPGCLSGSITPPPSKSQAHRLLIAAALSGGISTLSNVAFSQDIAATRDCLSAMGASFVEKESGVLEVHGLGWSIPQAGPYPYFDCGESGSTLRFLIPVALAVHGGGAFTGHGRLMERPQEPYFRIFEQQGISYEQKDGVLRVEGTLTAGVYELPGDVSSQFVTGLLYTLPLLEGESDIVLTSPLESGDYVTMTLQALEQYGVKVETTERGWHIPGDQHYKSVDAAVEADWSNAAFWYAAASLGCALDIQGLNAFSVQGDMRIVPYFLKLQEEGVVELDVSQCPDLVPPLAAMAALRAGRKTSIVNAGRLRIKESDRLATVTEVLAALGAEIEEGPDYLVIEGREKLPGGVTVSGHNDHRIAMMAAIAATRCEKPVTITGADCVKKSYPDFWRDYQALGGQVTLEETV